jgi:GT2 family glycosyltransferase
MSSNKKKYSIVTVNYNGEKFLVRLLESLKNQTYKDFDFYFVDNGSADKSLNIIDEYKSFLDIKIIKLDKNYGFAKANNIGIDKAIENNCEYVITLNNDIELDENCVNNINETVEKEKGKYDVFQILMINYFERNIIDAAGINFDRYSFPIQIGYKDNISNLNSISKEISGPCAGAAVYSSKSLNSVREKSGDYFDSRFFAYYEDVDLVLRLMKKGFKSLLIKDAIVYHIHSGTGNEGSKFKSYYLSRNLFFYLRKNLTEAEFKNNKSYYKTFLLRSAVANIIRGNFKVVPSIYKGYVDYKKDIEKQLDLHK